MNPDTCCTLLFGYYSQIRKTVNTTNISGRNVIVLQDIRCEKLNCKHGDYYIIYDN